MAHHWLQSQKTLLNLQIPLHVKMKLMDIRWMMDMMLRSLTRLRMSLVSKPVKIFNFMKTYFHMDLMMMIMKMNTNT